MYIPYVLRSLHFARPISFNCVADSMFYFDFVAAVVAVVGLLFVCLHLVLNYKLLQNFAFN